MTNLNDDDLVWCIEQLTSPTTSRFTFARRLEDHCLHHDNGDVKIYTKDDKITTSLSYVLSVSSGKWSEYKELGFK